MRILHAIRSVDPATGGPVEGVRQLSNINQSHGHDIDVLSLDSPASDFVKEFPLRCHAVGPSIGKYGYSTHFTSWLREFRTNYDVVVVNGIWQYNAFGAWRALHGTSTPYVVYTHGMLDPWFKRKYPLKHLKKWLYWPWADYRVLRDAAAVLFTCEEERRLARQSFWLYKANESVVSYGTSGPHGDALKQRELFMERFPQLRGKRCLLFLGRVHVKKGPDLLLQALADIFARLSQADTADIHLVMAGPDEHMYAQKLKALGQQYGLAARITWTGLLTGDMKWGAFYTADAFILPSHQENFGIAVAEALACGVPALISNQVNIWREVVEGGAGLVEPDSLAGTVSLIYRWLNFSRPEWHQFKERAVALYRSKFSIGQAALSLIRAIERAGVGCNSAGLSRTEQSEM